MHSGYKGGKDLSEAQLLDSSMTFCAINECAEQALQSDDQRRIGVCFCRLEPRMGNCVAGTRSWTTLCTSATQTASFYWTTCSACLP